MRAHLERLVYIHEERPRAQRFALLQERQYTARKRQMSLFELAYAQPWQLVDGELRQTSVVLLLYGDTRKLTGCCELFFKGPRKTSTLAGGRRGHSCNGRETIRRRRIC